MKLPISQIIGAFCLIFSTSLLADGGPGHNRDFALGLELGSSTLYGNGVVGGWRWFDYGEAQAGLGFNSSGFKLGVGHSFMFNFTRAIGMTGGASFVYSFGHDGEVELDAKFTPDGSATEEDLLARKSYSLTAAPVVGVQAGMFWDYIKSFRFTGKLCYGLPLSGNEVELSSRTTFDKPVEILNDNEFSEEFDREAEKVVKVGGLGFALGAAFLF